MAGSYFHHTTFFHRERNFAAIGLDVETQTEDRKFDNFLDERSKSRRVYTRAKPDQFDLIDIKPPKILKYLTCRFTVSKTCIGNQMYGEQHWATDTWILNRTLSENPTQFKEYPIRQGSARFPYEKKTARSFSKRSTLTELTNNSSQTYANNYDRYPDSVQMLPSWLTTRPKCTKNLNVNPKWII